MKHRRENEVKLLAGNRNRVMRRLARLGFKVLTARHLESNFVFDFPDLRLGRSGRLLRLRLALGECLLTFKGPPLRARRYASRPEIETRVEDGVIFREVLRDLGLNQVFVYQKYRAVFGAGGRADFRAWPQVAYDETPIGNFLELEGPGEWIDRVAVQLGYSPGDYITSTYRALYLAWCREKHKTPGNMVFRRSSTTR